MTLSHGWSSEAVKESVPLPVFVTLTDCAGGAAPPAVAEKARLAGAVESRRRGGGGGGGSTVKRHRDGLRRSRRAGGLTWIEPV